MNTLKARATAHDGSHTPGYGKKLVYFKTSQDPAAAQQTGCLSCKEA